MVSFVIYATYYLLLTPYSLPLFIPHSSFLIPD